MPHLDRPDTTQEATFDPFSWFDHKHHTPTEKLAEASELEASDDTPLLNPRHRGELLRLAITSSQLLADMAQRDIQRHNPASDAN